MKILDSSKDIADSKYFSNVGKGIKPFLIKEVCSLFFDKHIMIILNDNNEVDYYFNLFNDFFKKDNIFKFPSWDNIPYEEVSPSQVIINERFKTINCFKKQKLSKKPFILFTNIEAVIQQLPPKKILEQNSFAIEINQKLSLELVNSKLNTDGYEKVGVVLEPNEYAVRGGIIDVWPLGEEYPHRIDFLGNKIDTIRIFNPISQITSKKVKKIIISSSIESPRSEIESNRFIQNYRKLFGPSINKELFVHKLKNGIKTDGIENWLPLFYSDNLCNIDEFFQIDLILADEYFFENAQKKISEINKLYEDKKNFLLKEKEAVNFPLPPQYLYFTKKKLIEICSRKLFKSFSYLTNYKKESVYEINCKENIEFHSSYTSNNEIISRVKSIINDFIGKKKIIICYSEIKEKEKALSLLKYLSISNYRDTNESIEKCMDNLDVIDLVLLPIEEGFEINLLKIITLTEIFKTKNSLRPKKVRNNLIDIAQLLINDLVVHFSHGIGRYLGLKTIKINNSPHDCLVIEYLEKSKLYVPVEDIRLLSKFGDAKDNTSLDRLGAGSWNKRKLSVKKRIRDLANNLIILAAKRAALKGLIFNIDEHKLQEFSKNFYFTETDDQLATLEEVYRDLSSGKLMDRLVCGDVGFGKTEIALRSAFISVDNNYTVILIAPTTLLARQHFQTFQKRFEKNDIVGLIDRNTNTKQKSIIVQKLIKKDIKILISTHAIFSINLQDAEIGLVIVDEEQRFGVSHKEKIKKIKSEAHLLTLTATPIPRTLHMSLIGIKDLSLIKTPPVDRKSIETKVIKFDSTIIKKAIYNEKNRAGQIYLIVPKVRDIETIKKKIISIYPKLKIGIAHGKLTPKELETVMDSFYNFKLDLLISTTIVEAGLDIPRANTLIVYKSDYFGLAQLHQLRGRIGRSDKKAFAYFTLENNNISKNAVRRLKALQTMDELGAGMQLANYDLDIRGAGNLLGEEQSGQITQVGIEMYQRLLKECINDLKGIDNYSNPEEIEVSIKLPILIPDKYIPDLSLRLSLYRRVGEFQELREVILFKEEMINRFGLIPEEFSNYLDVMSLKLLAGKASISKIFILSQNYQITFSEKRKNYSEKFIKWITDNNDNIVLKDSHVIKIKHKIQDVKKQLANIIDLVKTMLILLKN